MTARSMLLWALFALLASTVSAREIDLSFPGRDPSLAWDGRGRLHAVWVQESGGTNRVIYRRLDDPSAKPVAVTPAGVSTSAHGEVPPLLEALPDGALVVAYAVPIPGKWQNEVHLQRSTDGGATWSRPVPLEAGGERGSHNEMAAAVTPGGTLVFAWLDKREGGRGLRVARSKDGLRFEADRTLDATTCECCGNEILAGSRGEVWIAYRDVSEGVRDFAVAASRDEGATFAPPRPLSKDGWKVEGCPHTGARLALGKGGDLWAAWFTGADPGIYVTRSTDSGSTWSPRQSVATPGEAAPAVAHPEIGALPDGRIAVLYEAVRRDGTRDIEVRLRQGELWSSPKILALGAVYPRLAVREEKAVVAFTRKRGNGTEVVVRSWNPAR
jgi:BNR repeat-like domain